LEDFAEDIRRVPLFRLIVPWLTGLLTGSWCTERSTDLIPFCILLLILLFWIILELFYGRKHYNWSYRAWMFILPVFILTGYLGGHLQSDEPVCIPDGEILAISGVIQGSPLKRTYGLRFECRTDAIYTEDTIMAVKMVFQVYFDTSLVSMDPRPGERWFIAGSISPVRKDPNPVPFDYADYLAGKGIYYRLFASEDFPAGRVELKAKDRWTTLPARVADRFIRGWGGDDDPETAVLRAITLGDKGSLTAELREAYSGAGASHVLAVSGLHVGMIWWVLDRILFFRGKRFFHRLVRAVLILGILWFYAALTGGTASVCRSVTMFSMVSLAGLLSRRSSVVNTIFLSALILLAADPARIYDTGFQLSYLAVLGIVLLQPRLSRIVTFRSRILNRIRDLVMVSLAAQLFTFPLSLHLFHQFPVAFIFTNLAVVPLASVLVTLFILTAPFFLAGILTEQIIFLLRLPAGLMNACTALITRLPGAVATDIHFTGWAVAGALAVVVMLTAFLIYRNSGWLTVALLAAAVSIGGLCVRLRAEARENGLLVAHFRAATVLAGTDGLYREYLILPGVWADTAAIMRWAEQTELARPAGCRSRIVVWQENMNGSGMLPGCLPAGEGLTLAVSGKFRVLIAGKGWRPEMTPLLSALPVDLVLPGDLPVSRIGEICLTFPGIPVIADGTTPPWVVDDLPEKVPQVWMTGEQGACYLQKHEFIQNSN